MKFLVISDVHGAEKSLNKIIAAYHKYDPDFSVVCGDITHFGPVENAEKILDNIPTDVIGIIGNCDPESVVQAYENTEEQYIELKEVERNGISFIGLSGAKYSEEKIEVFEERSKDTDVFVVHQPPYDHLDNASRNKHIGSQELLEVVKKNQPTLVLSGHVHEDSGILEEKGTVYVNPGPASDDNLSLVKMKGNEVNAKLI